MLALTIGGCNTSGCLDSQSSIPQAAFRGSDGEAVAIDSLEIGGVKAPHDTLLNSSMRAISTIYLPLRSASDRAAYFIRYCRSDLAALGVTDTVWISYTSRTEFVSEECGINYLYDITSCTSTHYLIEKVEVTDPTISSSATPSVLIYFHTVAVEPDTPEDTENPDNPDTTDDEQPD